MTDDGTARRELSRRSLEAALDRVRVALEQRGTSHIDRKAPRVHSSIPPSASMAASAATGAPALDRLCAAFHLSTFERDTLVLCAGSEMDAGWPGLCASASGDAACPFPTFRLALTTLAEPHWDALLPTGPLRRWRLLDLDTSGGLLRAPLRIDERVLHNLCGWDHLDERLAGLIEPLEATGEPLPSHVRIADAVSEAWRACAGQVRVPVMQLHGEDRDARRIVASAATRAVGIGLCEADALALPTEPADLDRLLRVWEREAALMGCALFVEDDTLDSGDATRTRAVDRLLVSTAGAIVVSTRYRHRLPGREVLTFEVTSPAIAERRMLWKQALGDAASGLDGGLEALAAQFHVDAAGIRAACAEGVAHASAEDGDLMRALWSAARANARPRLGDLVQRLDPLVTWEDLVLPSAQMEIVRQIIASVRNRARVHDEWGFAARNSRGLGVTALFYGGPGTGKTLCAEVVAADLRLDVWRIDLSQVVSKYIGDTERNLRRVFDAAEAGAAVLLFDESDALFGRRTEVKDAHDRFANIEVSYLLTRMEAYRGLAILTTNARAALDSAFLRRIRYVVEFPFPEPYERAEIWRRVLPPEVPTEGLDIERLARLPVSGGNIRNMALNAAFLAADEGAPVRMDHMLRAARAEFAKLEKPLGDADIRGWS